MNDPQWRQHGLCRTNPAAWDTPPIRVSEADRAIHYRQARAAINTCQECPVLAPCAADAAANPPLGMIQAGRPYDDQGTPARHCGHCRRPLLCRPANSRYCGETCSDRAYAARKTTAVAA